jgi:hypothetical protein
MCHPNRNILMGPDELFEGNDVAISRPLDQIAFLQWTALHRSLTQMDTPQTVRKFRVSTVGQEISPNSAPASRITSRM